MRTPMASGTFSSEQYSIVHAWDSHLVLEATVEGVGDGIEAGRPRDSHAAPAVAVGLGCGDSPGVDLMGSARHLHKLATESGAARACGVSMERWELT